MQKISYVDLRLEASSGRLPELVGRTGELQRLERLLLKSAGAGVLVVGPSGIGKTEFLLGFAKKFSEKKLSSSNLVMLGAQSLQLAGHVQLATNHFYSEAFSTLKDCIVFLDNFGELANGSAAMHSWGLLLRQLANNKSVKLVLSAKTEEVKLLEEAFPWLKDEFETLHLEQLGQKDLTIILQTAVRKMHPKQNIQIPEDVCGKIVKYVERFPVLGSLPKAGIHILDECLAEAKSESAVLGAPPANLPILNLLLPKTLTFSTEVVERVVSQKTGIPLTKLTGSEKEQLKTLEDQLNAKVVGQQPALSIISSVIQRAKLGLRNQNRPLGSFLLLGPSGVGKTETAKSLSDILYGNKKSFLRIDMSEFGEAHTVHRLLGSPPGYVGYESGGQLTNHLEQQPYSLVLLDEIEKANPKIFDIFLQLLDDGRLTSGQGATVDATQSVVMATSNLGVTEILAACDSGLDLADQQGIKDVVYPVLLQNFRAEFLNRFDAVLVYKPLTVEDLTNIALLEIKKIEQRTKQHNFRFGFEKASLKEQVAKLADPRFGARPVKRFIEDTCEALITKQLLQS